MTTERLTPHGHSPYRVDGWVRVHSDVWSGLFFPPDRLDEVGSLVPIRVQLPSEQNHLQAGQQLKNAFNASGYPVTSPLHPNQTLGEVTVGGSAGKKSSRITHNKGV